MILGIPCFENHHLTAQLVASLAETVRGSDFTLVIIDNASPTPYCRGDFDVPFRLRVIRNERNEGNWYPLRQVAELEPDHEIVAIAHNDIVIHEAGWDLRLQRAFREDPELGLVGFAGGTTIGEDGTRDAATVTNFRGTRGHAAAEAIGQRITGLVPSVAVDGLFMAFRHDALEAIALDRTLPPAHLMDYIWSAQVASAWRIATLGVECDHVGWSTEVRLASALEADWRRWCEEQELPIESSPMDAIRGYGRAWWERYRDVYWPCRTRTVAAISMFHNEEDVAEYVVRHMLAECELVIVADNASTDRTRTILEGIGSDRLILVDEPRFEFHQADTMNELADRAAGLGAEWIVPFDADEWWTAEGGRIADVLRTMPLSVEATATRTVDMVPQPGDPDDPDPFRRITTVRPGSLWSQPEKHKIAFRAGAGRLAQGNHYLEGRARAEFGPLRVRHYPFRTFDQMAAKLRHGRQAVLSAKLHELSGGHWVEWGALDDAGLRAFWEEWTGAPA